MKKSSTQKPKSQCLCDKSVSKALQKKVDKEWKNAKIKFYKTTYSVSPTLEKDIRKQERDRCIAELHKIGQKSAFKSKDDPLIWHGIQRAIAALKKLPL